MITAGGRGRRLWPTVLRHAAPAAGPPPPRVALRRGWHRRSGLRPPAPQKPPPCRHCSGGPLPVLAARRAPGATREGTPAAGAGAAGGKGLDGYGGPGAAGRPLARATSAARGSPRSCHIRPAPAHGRSGGACVTRLRGAGRVARRAAPSPPGAACRGGAALPVGAAAFDQGGYARPGAPFPRAGAFGSAGPAPGAARRTARAATACPGLLRRARGVRRGRTSVDATPARPGAKAGPVASVHSPRSARVARPGHPAGGRLRTPIAPEARGRMARCHPLPRAANPASHPR